MNWHFYLQTRFLFLAGFLVCAGLIAGALYLQHWVGLAPCPLCILQRVAFIAVGVVLFGGFVHSVVVGGDLGVRARRVYAGLAGVAAVLGALVAGRHVWLQSLSADAVPECGPGLDFLLEAFPLRDALGLILRGSGECAEVQWSLLGLTLPGWSLVWLVAFAGLAGFILLRRESN